ncbi:MAG: ion transporter [Porphyromonas sp.]|nr:ion transporter [Porphyromonas sp.]
MKQNNTESNRSISMRERIFVIIEKGHRDNVRSYAYDIFMIMAIIVSIVPLMFMTTHPAFDRMELVTVSIFIVDYILRWVTADLKLKRKGWSFLIYPFTIMAIVDLLSILPVLGAFSPAFKIFRLSRTVRIARLFKFFRYTDKIAIFLNVLKKERKVLLSVLVIALFYIFLTALVMFNTEPYINPNTGVPTFNSFFDALYWATVTLTTVGYGDLCPVTEMGRAISMLSSLLGVAIIALPSGVITASYLDELRKERNEE